MCTRFLVHATGQLEHLVWHNLKQNNACWCAGSFWTRTKLVPMGGLFCAQGADLHSVWKAYKHRNLFRQLGNLTVSAEGFPLWEGRGAHRGRISVRGVAVWEPGKRWEW